VTTRNKMFVLYGNYGGSLLREQSRAKTIGHSPKRNKSQILWWIRHCMW